MKKSFIIFAIFAKIAASISLFWLAANGTIENQFLIAMAILGGIFTFGKAIQGIKNLLKFNSDSKTEEENLKLEKEEIKQQTETLNKEIERNKKLLDYERNRFEAIQVEFKNLASENPTNIIMPQVPALSHEDYCLSFDLQKNTPFLNNPLNSEEIITELETTLYPLKTGLEQLLEDQTCFEKSLEKSQEQKTIPCIEPFFFEKKIENSKNKKIGTIIPRSNVL